MGHVMCNSVCNWAWACVYFMGQRPEGNDPTLIGPKARGQWPNSYCFFGLMARGERPKNISWAKGQRAMTQQLLFIWLMARGERPENISWAKGQRSMTLLLGEVTEGAGQRSQCPARIIYIDVRPMARVLRHWRLTIDGELFCLSLVAMSGLSMYGRLCYVLLLCCVCFGCFIILNDVCDVCCVSVGLSCWSIIVFASPFLLYTFSLFFNLFSCMLPSFLSLPALFFL